MTRRDFIQTGAATTAFASTLTLGSASEKSPMKKKTNPLANWKGFNLMPFFSVFHSEEAYRNLSISELDLKWIRDWGFTYVRLPFDYWFFVKGDAIQSKKMDPTNIRNLDETALEKLDVALEKCIEYGLHVTLNMHRCPGYCINGWDYEPFNLFKSPEAEDAFLFLWEFLSNRYKGISPQALSFNLLNEAPNIDERMSREDYRRVMLRAEQAIHTISPDREIIIDGTGVGRDIVHNMIGEDVHQAFHAYDPFRLTHYQTYWVGDNSDWPVPTWPYQNEDGSVSDERHLRLQVAPWAELAKQGIGVHCGEFGCYKRTPHEVTLGWFEALMEILKEYDIGYSLWNFRGEFGIIDSDRHDVEYEDWYGHKLDRKLLNILLKYL